MTKQIPKIIIMAVAVAIIPKTGLTKTFIEQQDYTFTMEIVRNIPATTFVIGEPITARTPRPPAQLPVVKKNKMLLTIRKSGEPATREQQTENVQPIIAPVLFERASATLSAGDKENILAALRNKIDKATPLKVTGYTCDLGTKQANNTLALQRATVVADFLQSQGYKVAIVTGEGNRNSVTRDPGMRHLNRRVEIGILTQPAGEHLEIK